MTLSSAVRFVALLALVLACHVNAFLQSPSFSFETTKTFRRPTATGLLSTETKSNELYSGISARWLLQRQQPTGRAGLTLLKSTSSVVEKETTTDTLTDKDHDDFVVGSAVLLVSSATKDNPSPFGSKSPVENPSWADAAAHLANKAFWFSNGKLNVTVVTLEDDDMSRNEALQPTLMDADALIALGIKSEADVDFVNKVFQARRRKQQTSSCLQLALGCSDNSKEKLIPIVGPYDSESLASSLVSSLPWTSVASGKRLQEQMEGLFQRWTSDDFLVALLLYFNTFVAPIDWVKHSVDATWEKGPIQNTKEFYDMITKCGDCVANCLGDESCSKCLNALTEIDTRDQVTSYRTIVSYESKLLQDFSFCILQKNNIFNCNSEIPTLPKVQPIETFRNQPLTVEDGRRILIGHLDDEDAPEGSENLPWSWKVACGANVAYDQFPSQHQLFYKNAVGRDMWYDPVFRVETVDGRSVWCKRHYKVRNGPVPGTFRLSVLDNGVTSNEFWTIAGVADDLSWIVFHYAGAATAVGQQYLGGLLCTPDGNLPPVEHREEIYKVLQSAGIQPWELFVVDNNLESPRAKEAGRPPLDFFRKRVMETKAAAAAAKKKKA